MFPSGVIISSKEWSPRAWCLVRVSAVTLASVVFGSAASAGSWRGRSLCFPWPALGNGVRSVLEGGLSVCVAGLEASRTGWIGDEDWWWVSPCDWKLMVHTKLSREAHDREVDKAGHRAQVSEPVWGGQRKKSLRKSCGPGLPSFRLRVRACSGRRGCGRRGSAWSTGGTGRRGSVEQRTRHLYGEEAGWGPPGLLCSCWLHAQHLQGDRKGQGRAGQGPRRCPGKFTERERAGLVQHGCPRLERTCWFMYAPCVINRWMFQSSFSLIFSVRRITFNI